MKPSDEIKAVLGNLTPDEKMVIILCSELYGCSWDKMLDELAERLKGRPYIFRLVNRIEDDMERIKKLRFIESEHKFSFFDYLDIIKP
jgi:hypothetical protein